MGHYAGVIIPAIIVVAAIVAVCVVLLVRNRGGLTRRVIGSAAPGGEPTEHEQKLAVDNYLTMSQVNQINRFNSQY